MSNHSEIDISKTLTSLRGMRLGSPAMQRTILKRTALGIIREANQTSVVPRRTGFLAGSSFIEEPRGGSVTVGYSADYAAAVHERHPTKAQWLLNTINTHARRILQAEAKAAHEENAKRRGGAS